MDSRVAQGRMRKRPKCSICIGGKVHGDICRVEVELFDPECDAQRVVAASLAHAVGDFGCVRNGEIGNHVLKF